MANTQTATDWTIVASKLNQQIDDLSKQQLNILNQVSQNILRQNILTNQLNNLPANTPERIAISNELSQLENETKQLENQSNQLSLDVLALNEQSQNAERQANVALSGIPNAQTNTAPGNPNPGDNTDIAAAPNPIDPIIDPSVVEPSTAPVENITDTDVLREPPNPDPTEYDQFTGLDTVIEANENALKEPPLLSDAETTDLLNNNDDINVALREPPNPNPNEYDQFTGLDTVIEANENALKEPPLLSDDEVNQYFDNLDAPEEPTPVTEEDVLPGSSTGIIKAKTATQASATAQDQNNANLKKDWRVVLRLAEKCGYLYDAPTPGILKPLADSKGLVFPYTPTIQVNYGAHYESSDIVHSNYKIHQYKSSSVDQITIGCDFTAQDTYEANYLLAVIHFLRSITKMFYGKDQNPALGTPPPLCYITGLGAYQFDNHPIAITGFNYNLPANVDYIRATPYDTAPAGVSQSGANASFTPQSSRMPSTIAAGGVKPPPQFPGNKGTVTPTYVPTVMNIQISAIPIVTRNDISNRFSLKDYATGSLLRGSFNKNGGIW